MTFKNPRAASLVLVAATLFPVPLCRAAQSLGEVARKNRKELKARKKKGEAPAKVFTNEDIARMPGPSATVSSAPSAAEAPHTESGKAGPSQRPEESPASAGASAAQAGKPEVSMKTRAYWQARFNAARSALAHAHEQQKLVEDEIRLLQIQKARELAPGRSSDLNGQIRARTMELQAKREATQNARRALDETEKEFKQSGAPQDWIQDTAKTD